MVGSAKPYWLLLPGHLCTDRLWVGLRESLVADGRDVAMADLSCDRSIDGMARRATASLRSPAVLVGFSMGGLVSLRIQAIAPGLVAGMVLISSNARAHMPEREAERIAQERRARRGGFAEIVSGDLVPSYFPPDHPELAALRRSAIAMAGELGPEVFLRQSEAIRTRKDMTTALSNVGCPCLIVGGGLDRLSPPEWQRELATGIPTSELAIMDRCGHFVPLEAPDELTAAMRNWADRHAL